MHILRCRFKTLMGHAGLWMRIPSDLSYSWVLGSSADIPGPAPSPTSLCFIICLCSGGSFEPRGNMAQLLISVSMVSSQAWWHHLALPHHHHSPLLRVPLPCMGSRSCGASGVSGYHCGQCHALLWAQLLQLVLMAQRAALGCAQVLGRLGSYRLTPNPCTT